MRWTYFLIERYRKITNVSGTILVAWFLSLIVSHMVASFFRISTSGTILPQGQAAEEEILSVFTNPQTQLLAYYAPICERNIFDSLHRIPCEEETPTEEFVDLDAAPTKSDIGATLVGTMVSTNPNFSFATIQASGQKESKNYYTADLILDQAKIYDIQRNRVFFVRNGRREYIEVNNLPLIYESTEDGTSMTTTSQGIRRIGDKILVSRAKIDATLSDLNQVVQQSRMVPNFEGGTVNGFKIFAIRPGSIFDELGLKNGDVIQKINGAEINSLEKALPMLQLVKNESSVSIDLLRGGSKKTLSVEIQ